MMLRSGLCGGHTITSRTYCSSLCWRWFPMTLAVCLGSLSCFRINLGPIIHLPDGIAWWISICPDFSALRTRLMHQISNSICRNATPNLKGTSTMRHCCLQRLIIVPLSSSSANKLLSAIPKYLILTHQSRANAAIFLSFCAKLSCLDLFPCQMYGFLAISLP